MSKQKPLPWTCLRCRTKTVWPVREPYVAEYEHDGRAYQVRLESLDFHRCSACGWVMLTAEATRAIDARFREVAGLLTPEEISAKRKKLGLTQEQFAGLLEIDEATVSRWETGAQIQQRAMDKILRAFFDLPELQAYLGYKPNRPVRPASVSDAHSSGSDGLTACAVTPPPAPCPPSPP